MSGDMPAIQAIPASLLMVAQGAVAQDFLGKVPGMHGVAMGSLDGKPAIMLTGMTPRPPVSHRIPERLVITIQGEKYAVPLVWIQTNDVKPGAIVPNGMETTDAR